MIQLFLDGQNVALFLTTKIGIHALNPYFNDMEGSSYPFTIPYAPNAAILKQAGRIQNATRTFSWSAVLMHGSVVIMRGEAIASGDMQNGEFPLILRSMKTSFIKLAEATKMQDMDFGGDTFDAELTYEELQQQRTSTLNSSYPTMNFVCAPFYNTAAWSETEQKAIVPNYINQFNPVTKLLDDLVVVPATTELPSRNTWNAITYSFYVRYILKKIIETLGYTVDADDMETIPDLNKWFLLSFNRFTDMFSQYRGAFPEISIREFLSVMRQFGIVLIINDTDKSASIRLLRDLFAGAAVSSLLNGGALIDTLVLSIPPGGYVISFNGSADAWVIQEETNVIIIGTQGDLPEASSIYSNPSLLYYVSATQRHFLTVLQPKAVDTDPDVYAWQPVGLCRPYRSGDGETKVELGATAVGQRWETRTVTITTYGIMGEPTTATWDIELEMPSIAQKMNAVYGPISSEVVRFVGDKYEDPPLVFLFNWGLRTYFAPDPAVFTEFPVISGDAWDRSGTEKGSISMRTSGEKSIIAQLVKDEQEWKLRRKNKRQYFKLSLAEYANFKWNEIQNINSVNYFVNSLTFDIDKNGISLIEADLFTV